MASRLDEGSHACVHSVTSRPELNGEVVTVVAWDTHAQRWICAMQGGGQVALREANLQPIRGAPSPRRAGAGVSLGVQGVMQSVARLPWVHFFGGLLVTVMIGYFFAGSSALGTLFSSHPVHGRRRRSGRSLYDPAHLVSFLLSWAPFCGLLLVAAFVFAAVVEVGGDGSLAHFQRWLRRLLSRATVAATRAYDQLQSFHVLILVVAVLLTWSIWTDKLHINLEGTNVIILPVAAYILYTNRNRLDSMSPFQMLWLLDMASRLLGPGHGRRAPRYQPYGYGGMRRGAFY